MMSEYELAAANSYSALDIAKRETDRRKEKSYGVRSVIAAFARNQIAPQWPAPEQPCCSDAGESEF
jgi:hypothetical protein